MKKRDQIRFFLITVSALTISNAPVSIFLISCALFSFLFEDWLIKLTRRFINKKKDLSDEPSIIRDFISHRLTFKSDKVTLAAVYIERNNSGNCSGDSSKSKKISELISSLFGDCYKEGSGNELTYIVLESEGIELAKSRVTLLFDSIRKEHPDTKMYCGISVQTSDPIYDPIIRSDRMLMEANIALEISKVTGKEVTISNKAIIDEFLAHAGLKEDLLKSIDKKQLEIVFQPKFSSVDLSVVGFEALCRWNHDYYGYVSPNIFIKMAEETGFINQIGEFILMKTIKNLELIRDSGYTELTMAVNVSMFQLEKNDGRDFLLILDNQINNSSVPAKLMELEITESQAAESNVKVIGILNQIKEHGIKLSLDDFGTGYSSLLYLKDMPIDQIKIDKGFIDNIQEPKNRSLVNSIIKLSKELGMTTVSEGIETEEQLKIIRNSGCDYIQGFLLSKPIPEENILSYLGNES